MALDIDFVRSQFPAFAHAETGQWAFFENAGGAYAPRCVIDKLHHFMVATKVQPYGPSGPSREAGEAMDLSQRRIAEAINAEPEEVMFGPSTSMNTYVLAQALRQGLQAGDEVIVTNQDHEANIGAWRRLAEGNSGIIIREWQVDPETGLLDLSGLEGLLSSRTKLVCVTHCSNIAGEIHEIPAIAGHVHAAGALLAVDGVSYAPHLAIDVKALAADFYFYSLYKVYGPHQGILYAKREQLERIANQGHYFNAGELGKRLTPAGPQHGEIACASGVVDYLEAVDSHHFGGDGDELDCHRRVKRTMDLFHAHEVGEANRLLDLLRAKPVRILGRDVAEHGRRAPTIAFVSAARSNEEISAHLEARRIACGVSDFYARRLLEACGINADDGVIRLSMVHYNSEGDVTRLLEALDDIL